MLISLEIPESSNKQKRLIIADFTAQINTYERKSFDMVFPLHPCMWVILHH